MSPLDFMLSQQPQDEATPTGFDAWFANLMSTRRQIKGDMRGEKIVGGTFSGMTTEEARQRAQEMWQQLPPDQQNEWATRATGAPLLAPSEQGEQPPKELPPLLRNNPNAPGLNSPSMGSGRSTTGPGRNVAERFAAMGAAQAVRAAGAKEAVTAKRIEQVLNPTQTVDAARAVRDAALAQSGITDMGGGKKALSNKYGTGFATQGGLPTPGPHVYDDGKPVDMAASRAKGSIVTMPGDNAVPSVAFKEDIAAKVAAAAPGAGARLAQDRGVEIGALHMANMASGDYQKAVSYVNTPQTPVTPPPAALPDDRPGVASRNFSASIAARTLPSPAKAVAATKQPVAQPVQTPPVAAAPVVGGITPPPPAPPAAKPVINRQRPTAPAPLPTTQRTRNAPKPGPSFEPRTQPWAPVIG